jgi:hypothetical protein
MSTYRESTVPISLRGSRARRGANLIIAPSLSVRNDIFFDLFREWMQHAAAAADVFLLRVFTAKREAVENDSIEFAKDTSAILQPFMHKNNKDRCYICFVKADIGSAIEYDHRRWTKSAVFRFPNL